MGVIVRLDVMMALRKVRGQDLAARVGITPANLSKLKTGRVKAIRFSTLCALCRELDCQPGDLLEYDAPELGTKQATRRVATPR